MDQDKRTSEIERQIDEILQRAYREALQEPVPQKFLDLIGQLKAGEARDDGR